MIQTHLFMGPCVLESQELADQVADFLNNEIRPLLTKASSNQVGFELYFKGSFDKANRSSYDSYRGPGLEAGLEILQNIREHKNLKTITDIHEPSQAKEVAKVCDVLQIPAFLCRQTDLVVEAAKACNQYNKKLKVKKGQFLSPHETKNIVDKVAPFMDINNLFLTERGTSFGYQSLIVDMTSFSTMKSFGVRTVFDCTHSVQRPGALGKATGGAKEFILPQVKAALGAGAEDFFMEVHPQPSEALSDKTTQLSFEEAKTLITEILWYKEVRANFEKGL